MENEYFKSEQLPAEVNERLVLLLKLADKESKHFIKFRGTKAKGVYYLMGKSNNKLHCICSCEQTVIAQADNSVLDVYVVQFALDLDLLYRMWSQASRPNTPLIYWTHQALLDFFRCFSIA